MELGGPGVDIAGVASRVALTIITARAELEVCLNTRVLVRERGLTSTMPGPSPELPPWFVSGRLLAARVATAAAADLVSRASLGAVSFLNYSDTRPSLKYRQAPRIQSPRSESQALEEPMSWGRKSHGEYFPRVGMEKNSCSHPGVDRIRSLKEPGSIP